MNQQLLLVRHLPQASAIHSCASSVTNWSWWLLWWTPLVNCYGELLRQNYSGELLSDLFWWTAMARLLLQTAITTCSSRLLPPDCSWWTHTPDCCHNQSLTPFIVSAIHCCQLLVCSLPRYMRAYRALLSCNNSPLLRLRGYLAYSTVGRNLVVSVAWQWLFSTLNNSAFQAICHNING
jgi:hypothetical protein